MSRGERSVELATVRKLRRLAQVQPLVRKPAPQFKVGHHRIRMHDLVSGKVAAGLDEPLFETRANRHGQLLPKCRLAAGFRAPGYSHRSEQCTKGQCMRERSAIYRYLDLLRRRCSGG